MAAAVAATGTALSAVGAIRQGNSNADISDYNAQIADQNAAIVTAQGQENARRALVQSRKMIGSEAAAYGASGVGAGGSAQWVMRNSASQGELNALTIQNNAAIKATAYKNEAALNRFRGSNYQLSGYMNAASSLLHGGSQTAGMRGGGGGGGGGGMTGAGDYEDTAGDIA